MTYANEEEEFINLDMDEAYAPELRPFHVEKCIQIMRTLGADVNAQDDHEYTPLHLALKFGNAPAAETLLRFPEVNLSIKDCRGLTPLDWAVVDRREAIAEALRSRGGIHSEGWQTRLRPLYSPRQDDAEDQQPTAEWAIASA